MFWQFAAIIPRIERGFMHSAFLESFLIHLRNLIEFVYDEGRKDDVVARDFFDKPGRITRKSTRPRASDRSMVDTYNRRACWFQKPIGVVATNKDEAAEMEQRTTTRTTEKESRTESLA